MFPLWVCFESNTHYWFSGGTGDIYRKPASLFVLVLERNEYDPSYLFQYLEETNPDLTTDPRRVNDACYSNCRHCDRAGKATANGPHSESRVVSKVNLIWEHNYMLWDHLSGLVTFTRRRCKYGSAFSFTLCVLCTIIISCSLTSKERIF